jgi:hypothetical protein
MLTSGRGDRDVLLPRPPLGEEYRTPANQIFVAS